MLRIFSRHLSSWKLLLLAGDTGVYFLSVFLALILNPMIEIGVGTFFVLNFFPFLLMWLVYLTVFFISDLYDFQQDYRYWPNVAKVLISTCSGSVLLIVIFYFPKGVFIGRTQLLLQAGNFAILMMMWRWTFSALALPERLARRVVIVGAGGAGRKILEALRRRPKSGLIPVGFVDDDPQKNGLEIEGFPVLGNSSQLPDIIQQQRGSLAIVAITHDKSQGLINALTKISWNGIQVADMPSLYEFLAGKIPVDHISDLWLFLQSVQTNKVFYRHFKRLMDLALASLALLCALPMFGLIALCIKLDSRGPVFFRQERLGQEGKPFSIIKFRTMLEDAEINGPQWTAARDPRITRVGWFLRKFRLDELPQLMNILKGDMSFIGPRPEREVFVRGFQELVPIQRPGRRASDQPGVSVYCGSKEKVPFYSYRLLVKPGITGWAQVRYPYASSQEQTKEKLQYDLYYIKNMGFMLDLAILLRTVRIVLFGRGT